MAGPATRRASSPSRVPLLPRPRPAAAQAMRRAAQPALFALLAVLAASSVDAQAPTRRDTTPAGVSVRLAYDPSVRPGVAVLPVSGADGDSVRAILQRDLDFGNRVTVLTGRAADAPALAGGRVSYDLARTLGALAVVQASVTPAGLRVTLHDVANRRALASRDVALPADPRAPAWRLAVHGAADEIERWITGVRGIAATRVAFVRDRRVWVVDSDGENARPLGERGALSPAWHPGGDVVVHGTLDDAGRQRIVAFQSLTGGQFQVMTLSLRDRSVKRLTAEGRNEDPSWAPDSRHLVFTSTRSGVAQLFVVDAETGRTRQLTRGGGAARMAAWSPPLAGSR